MSASVKELTANVDLQLTEVCVIVCARELRDDVSVILYAGRPHAHVRLTVAPDATAPEY